MSAFKVLDLFAGCGGLSTGFKQAGFTVDVACDNWKVALDTHEKNHSTTKVVLGDLTDKAVQKEVVKTSQNKVDVIVGGPPCQAYSLAGARDPEDPRGKLFESYVEIVKELEPKIFVIENVKGILSMKHFKKEFPADKRTKIMETINGKKSKMRKISIETLNSHVEDYMISVPQLIRETFEKIGYSVEWKLLNAADFGVPQERKRVFFIGTNLNKKIIFPTQTHTKTPNTLLPQWRTLKDAIYDMPFPEISAGDEVCTGSFSTIYMSRNRRRRWDEASFTIQAGARHIPLHPGSPPMKKIDTDEWVFGEGPLRRLSVVECARIQTFPPEYTFCGSMANKYRQIGNAVPPLLGKKVGECIKKMLK